MKVGGLIAVNTIRADLVIKMNSFYKLYEHITKEKLYIESIVSNRIKSLKDALEFIGSESQTNLSNLAGQKLSQQDFEVIKSAYKKLMFKWHPDKVRSLDPETQQNSKEYAVAANFAFEKLEKAFREQTPINSSSFSNTNNWSDRNYENITIEELKEKLDKNLKNQFPDSIINSKLTQNTIQAELKVDSKTNPDMFEGLPITSNFDPFFHVFVESNTKEWQAKITLYNKANDQKLLEHTIKELVKEQEVGALAWVVDYYDNLYKISGFMEITLKKAINHTPLEDLAKRIKKINGTEVKAKGNTLSLYFTNTSELRRLIGMDNSIDWPQLNHAKDEILNHQNHNINYGRSKTFVPKKLYLVMNLYEDKVNLTLSDSTMVNVYKTVPLTGQYDKKEKEFWLKNIVLNEVRSLISAIREEYHKISLENLKDYKLSDGKKRGLNSREQKEYENIKQNSSIEIQRIN